MIYTTKDKTCV